jgi:hypothetical protein
MNTKDNTFIMDIMDITKITDITVTKAILDTTCVTVIKASWTLQISGPFTDIYPCNQDLRDITVRCHHGHHRRHGHHSTKTTTDIMAVKNITDILAIKNSSYSALGQIRNNYFRIHKTALLHHILDTYPLPRADIRTHPPEQLSSCSPHRTYPISFILKLENLDFYRSLVSISFLTKMAWRHCYSLASRDSSARFFGLVIFHGSTLYGPLISRLKGFYFIFRFSRRYSNISMNPRCRLRLNNLALLSL